LSAEYATTYLTGTLTSLIAGLATPGSRTWPGWRQPGGPLALAAGALINGILAAHAPRCSGDDPRAALRRAGPARGDAPA
jgi:hypothetical protein